MVQARPHLLLLGWYRPGTGFTRVLSALAQRLARHYRITWFGVGYQGPAQQLSDQVRLEPTNLRGGDMVGAYAVRARWQQLAVDAILALNDLWYLKHYSEVLGPIRGRVPMLGYLPLDGRIARSDQVQGVDGFSALVTYTQSAAADLRAALQTEGIDVPVDVAGHGVDLSQFSPASSIVDAGSGALARMALAQQYFNLPAPGFVVLNASRPDARKRIDLTLAGFAQFAAGLPEHVYLCLHHAIVPDEVRDGLRAQARDLGIEARILWSPHQAGPIDDYALNALYNACALGLNTALGEGFGLVSFEHAATGVPQLLPAHPALRELWVDAAQFLGPVRTVQAPSLPLLMGEIDASAVCAGLRQLYDNGAEYLRLAEAALRRARAPEFSWDTVAAQFLQLFLPDGELGIHGARHQLHSANPHSHSATGTPRRSDPASGELP